MALKIKTIQERLSNRLLVSPRMMMIMMMIMKMISEPISVYIKYILELLTKYFYQHILYIYS